MTTFGLLLVTCTFYYTCLALPNIHKQMTTAQLQSIFHTDDVNSVPEYELIQLVHQGTQHKIHRRSIDQHQDNNGNEYHHVKKDLSKSPLYTIEKIGANNSSGYGYNDKLNKINLKKIKEHNVSFSAFGEVLNLTLKPVKGLFKDGPESLRMWMVRSEPSSNQGLEYDEIQDESTANDIGEIFQDEGNMAAVLMRKHLQTDDLIMEGSIGHDIIIKPLPHDLSINKRELHHIVYKREADFLEKFSDFALMEPDHLEEKTYRKKRSAAIFNPSVNQGSRNDSLLPKFRKKRAAPYIIYPEILVIVDYDGYRLHGGDNVQVKRYFVSFWNGVDLRYRLIKGPRIRISIAGIIISRGRDATPYLERNRVGRDAIDSAAALTDMGKYLFRERRLPVYDIAVAITKLDMCRRSYPYGECKRGTAGFAYVGGACVVNKRLEKVNSVAIIEDTGGFSGIIVAAHEVGHLLGAVHDGSPPPSYLGGPGAEKCRWEDGYIMSDLRHTERGFRWSPCTIQSFHHFLNGDTATCLHNAPHEDNALGRALPGTLLSLDAQCRRDRGTYACFKDDRVCAQLFCFDSQTGYCVAYRPAAEGSSCGNGLICLDGRCVAHHSNVIPDYSHHHSHAYRPAYRENDDLDDESTKNSSKTITITSTTTPPTPSTDYELPQNVDNYLTSTDQTPKSFEKTSFDVPFNDISSTTAQTSTINPFYNDFKKYVEKSVNNFSGKSATSKSTSGSTRKPFNFQNFFRKNKNKNNNSTINNNLPSLSDQSQSSSAIDEDESSKENIKQGSGNITTRNYIFNGRIPSRSPIIESYVKKITKRRTSYNFENITHNFNKRSRVQPFRYSSNVEENSNNTPVNVTINE